MVVVAGYRMLLPPRTSAAAGTCSAPLVVLLLVAAVAAPAVLVGRLAAAQRDLIAGRLRRRRRVGHRRRPAADPFGDQERVNVLLLGGDGGEDRDGVRTDTVIVASIDTDTGDTTLFSLPRNLENLPFPADSPLAEVYPDGFEAGDESESLLNAVYRNGPAEHPDILGPTDNPGADFLKLGVGEALGLTIDYYVLVNLDGFSRLVDALGGITVNVNYYVPVGGEPVAPARCPTTTSRPGPNQHMDGADGAGLRPRPVRAHRLRPHGPPALHDQRDHRGGRPGDPARAVPGARGDDAGHRQHRHPAVRRSTTSSTSAFLVKDADVRSVVFDATLIDPAYPDYDQMRADRRRTRWHRRPTPPRVRRHAGDAATPAAPADRAAPRRTTRRSAPRTRRPTSATPAPTTRRRPRRRWPRASRRPRTADGRLSR